MSSNLSSGTEFNPQNPLLLGVSGKLNRARQHIQELDDWFDEWIETNPWSVESDFDPDGTIKRLYVDIRNPIPSWVGLIIGDAIHNIRCALDHLAAAEAIKNGNTTKDVYFPIASSASAYTEARAVRKRDKLRKCSKAFGDFVDGLKPYNGGNFPLFALHQLDIIDKHQVLVPVGTTSQVFISAEQGFYGAFDLSKTDKPVPVNIPNRPSLISNGDTVMDFSSGSLWFPKKTKIETESALSVAFGNETPVAGKEIASTIKGIFNVVEAIIKAAEPKFFR